MSGASTATVAQAKGVLGEIQYEAGLEVLRDAERSDLTASQIALQIAAIGASLATAPSWFRAIKSLTPTLPRRKSKNESPKQPACRIRPSGSLKATSTSPTSTPPRRRFRAFKVRSPSARARSRISIPSVSPRLKKPTRR